MVFLPWGWTMSSPIGVPAIFLWSWLFSGCQSMSLTTDPTTKAWQHADKVTEPTHRTSASELPLWTFWSANAKMVATASPPEQWAQTSVNQEEADNLSKSTSGVVSQVLREFMPIKVEQPHTPDSADNSPRGAATDQGIGNQAGWQEGPDHMDDAHIRQTKDIADTRESSVTTRVPLRSEAPEGPIMADTLPDARSAPDRSTARPDLSLSIPASTPHPESQGQSAREAAPGIAVDTDTSVEQEAGTEPMTLVLHGEDFARRPTAETSLHEGIFGATWDEPEFKRPLQRPLAEEEQGTTAGDSDQTWREPGGAVVETVSAELRATAETTPTRGTSVQTVNPIDTGLPPDESWQDPDTLSESSSLPDCNAVTTGICDTADATWAPPSRPLPDDISANSDPDGDLPSASLFPLAPGPMPLLVPLRSDWRTAKATWGLAWEAHVYGLGCVFVLVAAISGMCLLCLPLRWPLGCCLFATAHLLQFLAAIGRAFLLFYDPYGQRERLSAPLALLLHEAPFPCLTAAFGATLLLLSARSRTQLLPLPVLQHSACVLSFLLLAHFGLALGSVGLGVLLPGVPCLALIPPGAFVTLAPLLSVAYLLFYCCARIDAKHIYRLSEASPERACAPDRVNPCPFAEAGVWERAAGTGVFAALFLLACGGLRLYAMLLATGLTGEGQAGLPPWSWWGLQFAMRSCEASLCLALALIVTQPLLCCGTSRVSGTPKSSCWPGFSWRTPGGQDGPGKPSLLAGGYGWSLRSGEKLCEGLTRKESESVPLYTLADQHLSEAEGLDLVYPGTPSELSAKKLVHTKLAKTTSGGSSFASLDGGDYCDSTVDLRPPSPIDLRRSIDEALFSESLFSRGLFCSSRLSLSTRGPPDGQPCRGPGFAEAGLYRTSSCGDVDQQPATGMIGSPNQILHAQKGGAWRGGSSGSLCGGPAARSGTPLSVYSSHAPGPESQGARGSLQSQKRYSTLGSASSKGSLCNPQLDRDQVDELAVQAEFINVCRQIDALSVSSDTIDL